MGNCTMRSLNGKFTITFCYLQDGEEASLIYIPGWDATIFITPESEYIDAALTCLKLADERPNECFTIYSTGFQWDFRKNIVSFTNTQTRHKHSVFAIDFKHACIEIMNRLDT
jgi:hypothetical protein